MLGMGRRFNHEPSIFKPLKPNSLIARRGGMLVNRKIEAEAEKSPQP
jgi:hypothetical protein